MADASWPGVEMTNRRASSGDARSSIAEDLLRSLEPAIERVEDALRKPLSEGQGDPRLAFALRSIVALRGFLRKIIEGVADQDLVERAGIYQLITERCAESLGRPADMVYPAVLGLCGESDGKLIDDLPVPDPEIVSALAQVLVQVTVTYALKDGERAARTVVVLLHDADERQVREQKIMEEMPWEKIPDDVRERFVRDGQQPVVFILYPGGQ